MLSIRSRGFDLHNTVLLDIWWNMLIKFNKQIGNSFAKIINTKVSSKLCQPSEMELFPQIATGFRGESCQTSKMELFAQIIKNEKPFTIFAKTTIF